MSNDGNCLLSDGVVTLRAPEPADLERLYRWENDPSQWNVGCGNAPMSHKMLWDYIDSYDGDIFSSRQQRFVVQLCDTGDAIGTIDLFDFDPVNRHAQVGIYIQQNARGLGYATRSLALISQHAMSLLGMRCLMAVTAQANRSALGAFLASGFSKVGVLNAWLRDSHDQMQNAEILQKTL